MRTSRPQLFITEKELEELETAIYVAVAKQSTERLEYTRLEHLEGPPTAVPFYFHSEDGSLVISFDAGWYPFLCNTRGYNQGPARWYIPKTSRLLALIAQTLQTPIQRRVSYLSGGRVFIDSQGVRRRPQGHGEMVVLTWSLPRSSIILQDRGAGV